MSVSGYSDSIQFKRLQVMNVWKEIKQLEEELEEKLVSTVTTTATKGHIRDQQVLHLASFHTQLVNHTEQS